MKLRAISARSLQLSASSSTSTSCLASSSPWRLAPISVLGSALRLSTRPKKAMGSVERGAKS